MTNSAPSGSAAVSVVERLDPRPLNVTATVTFQYGRFRAEIGFDRIVKVHDSRHPPCRVLRPHRQLGGLEHVGLGHRLFRSLQAIEDHRAEKPEADLS